MVNQTTSEESYQSIINADVSLYGVYANTTFITTDFRGIGLPTTSYNIFTNLMDIISQGQVACAKVQGGFCVLPRSCDNYESLWTYSFRIQFSGQTEYLTVPLGSFAATQNYLNYTECFIYVEELDESLANSLQIVLGNMFFQSFSYLQQFEGLSTTVTLAVSPNALDATYLGTFADFT
jgi:hypothetical protein